MMEFLKKMQTAEEDRNYTFSRVNYILITIGVVILIIGFVLLSGGTTTNPNDFYPNGDETQVPEIFNFRRLTVAPIVILFGFVFEIFAILWKPKNNK